MNGMSITRKEMTMTIGGHTFPVENVEIEHQVLREHTSNDRFYCDKMFVACFKPKDAQDFNGQDGRDLPLGSWVQGMYTDTSGAYRHGWGVLCAKPGKLPPCMSQDGTRSIVVYFLPEGGHGVRVMQLCDMWKIAEERPEEKKFDFLKHFKFMERYGVIRGKFKDALYGTRPHPVTLHDRTVVEPSSRLTAALNGDWVFDIGLTNIQPIAADDDILDEEIDDMFGSLTDSCVSFTQAEAMAVSVDAEGLPTHWHCPDCGEDNDFNVSPRKCGICRRARP